jgi:hypothetical protein
VFRIDKTQSFRIFRDYDKALEICNKISEESEDEDFSYKVRGKPGGNFLIEVLETETGKHFGFL